MWWVASIYLIICWSMQLHLLVLCKKISQIRRQSRPRSGTSSQPNSNVNSPILLVKEKEASKTTSTATTISKDQTTRNGNHGSKRVHSSKASSQPQSQQKVTAASKGTSTTVKSSEDSRKSKNKKEKTAGSERKSVKKRGSKDKKKHKKSKKGKSRKEIDINKYKLEDDVTLDPGIDIEELDAENDFPIAEKFSSNDTDRHDRTPVFVSGRENSDNTPIKSDKQSCSYR
ncbi:unnamed protein product [Bursaphelenchus xylophilus]|uniref:(pine wood nematode) hypothetical protein n=1 Tax=Bursaphelenchus xylophilus TaxID=6326 RepID=A0A1I7RSE5_BURXY|nr:unnamed protein product [Bursaphelenchus xylophilus]CAG9123010.1 unnamed protein product [Bursaphelenchus xylophilus]